MSRPLYSSINISCNICGKNIVTVTRRDEEAPLTDEDVAMYLQNCVCETPGDGQSGLSSQQTFRMGQG